MEEDLKACEFWLPPQFLTNDDIFLGFKKEENERKRYLNEFSYGFNMFGPHSDLSSPVESVVGSSETESDEEDFFTELTRQMAHSTLESQKRLKQPIVDKVQNLSSSPQSTLCGVMGSTQGLNSETPNSPFQVSSPTEVLRKKGTVDLLYAAVGEVAIMKKMEEEVGFCHHENGIWAPPCVGPKMSKPNLGSFYSNQPPPPAPLSYQQFKMAQFQRLRQQQIMKQRLDGIWEYQLNKNQQERNGADRPLDMAMSAWPTLQHFHHHQHQKQPPQPQRGVFLGNQGPKRECAGTGVFIPRRVGTHTETRKKPGSTVFLPDRVVQALNLNLQPQVQPRFNNGGVSKYRNNNVRGQQWRNLRNQPAAMSQELQLPQEWTY